MQRACGGADARWAPALDRVGRQEGGLSRAATHPPLRHARGRLVPCGHAPALAVRKKAACPVRPRTRPCGTQEGGLSRPATDRLVLCGHAPALAAGKKAARPVRPRTRPCGTQEGGSSCAVTHPPLPQARRRLVPCGHAPALAARKKAACPVRPRTGLSCRGHPAGLLAHAELLKHPVHNLLADLLPGQGGQGV